MSRGDLARQQAKAKVSLEHLSSLLLRTSLISLSSSESKQNFLSLLSLTYAISLSLSLPPFEKEKFSFFGRKQKNGETGKCIAGEELLLEFASCQWKKAL